MDPSIHITLPVNLFYQLFPTLSTHLINPGATMPPENAKYFTEIMEIHARVKVESSDTHPASPLTALQHIISIYPINTPYQHTRSIHHINPTA